MSFGSDGGSIRTWGNDLSHRQIMEECARLQPGEMWTDKRFPADDPRSVYVTGRPASGKPYANGNIRWLRPHEVKGADPSLLSLVLGGAEAGDVVQGELGDCYLLGAMSSIASKDLLTPLLREGTDPATMIARGFMTFKLYKFGEWCEVSVDTLLPCNAEGECVFAHGNDPNELWVPLLEKAYAKLHGSYEALDGGSVTAALVDLTGGVGESIDMTDEDTRSEIAEGKFWKRLCRYVKKDVKKTSKAAAEGFDATSGGQYLLGAALSQNGVPDSGGHEAMQVTDLGILVNHAYSLIDVGEVGEGTEKTKLVQLRNPWGMKEWEGPWSDNAPEWETASGRKAMEQLNVTFSDDGSFWMAWEQFQEHFNKIYVCRIFSTVPGSTLMPPIGSWCRYEVEGEWDATNSGGCFNFPEWRKNPQFEIRTRESTDAVFLLMQRDPRTAVSLGAPQGGGGGMGADASEKKGGDDGGPSYDCKIGMYVMRGHETYRRKVLYDSEEMEGEEVVDSTPYMAYREVTCNTFDEEEDKPLDEYSRYVLIPSTFAPGGLGQFRIIVLTNKPLDQPPELIPRLNEMAISGAWTDTNAGGCRKHFTWRRNEQYHLQLSSPARVSVVLMRHNPDAASLTTALHCKKKTARVKKKKAKDPNKFLIGFVVFPADPAEPRATRKRLHVESDDIVDKTLFSPTFEVAAEFYTEHPKIKPKCPDYSYIIVPSTYDPGMDDPTKQGDFELVVYTDDARASLHRIEPSTWHFQELNGEWSTHLRSAGGCRNYPSWVLNPLYTLRASRPANCMVFLRQPERMPPDLESLPEYPGIGFYVTADDGSLSLDDVKAESGFRQLVESHKEFQLEGDMPYMIIPMTYRKNISMPFTIEVYCDQPSCRVEMLPQPIADVRREEMVKHEAARTITRMFLCHRAWGLVRARPPNPQRAHDYIVKWFGRPVRDNDEGYVDINLALNALEAAYIQLTGKVEMKKKFFPQMRKRLQERGHVIADYDVCL